MYRNQSTIISLDWLNTFRIYFRTKVQGLPGSLVCMKASLTVIAIGNSLAYAS